LSKSAAEVLFGDRAIMNIPLQQHMFVMTSLVTNPKRSLVRTSISDSKSTLQWVQTQTAQYRLVDRLMPYLEGDDIPGNLNRSYVIEYVRGLGVCVRVADHSFGRGLVRLILGWSLIVSVHNRDADKFQRMLFKQAKGEHIRSRLWKVPSTAFNLELEDDLEVALEAKMRFDGVAVTHSQIPITRTAYLIEDYTDDEDDDD
jgi:hypothetical protein